MRVAFLHWPRLWRFFMLALALGCAHAAPAGAAGAAADKDFWVAIRDDHGADVKAALARGVDPNSVNPATSNTPLLEAVKNTSWRVYDALLADRRIDIDKTNALGESPLMYLALLGELDRAKTLIARGAQVNKPGWTALHYAASKGHDDVVRLLLDHYAYIDAESPQSRLTPLMMAARYDHGSTAKLLVDEGADGYFRNAQGKNAVDVAREAGNTYLADDLATQLNQAKKAREAANAAAAARRQQAR